MEPLCFRMDGAKFYSECNKNCSCHLDLYNPVCDHNNKQYFSPCFAGCTDVVSSSEQVLFLVCCSLRQLMSNDQFNIVLTVIQVVP